MNTEKTKAIAAAKSGMDEKTARKYVKNGKLPSECATKHMWRTRKDPFETVWASIVEKLEINSGLEAKTLFQALQREKPGVFEDGQLRTLQRKISYWRATEGPEKEIFFNQVHEPGQLCASDFTHMDKLNITIEGQHFKHLFFHFVLTYSNWETGTLCYSESFESLAEGIQAALWKLGGVVPQHRTDCLSAAVHKECNPEIFTKRYTALMAHYRMKGAKTQPASPNENGDAEQSHNRFKKAVDQALMLRDSRDFKSIEEYKGFIEKIFDQLNSGRQKRFQEELALIKELPETKWNASKKETVKVSRGSTAQINYNTYSVPSRLIGKWIDAYINADHIDVLYGKKKVDSLPRLHGRSKHRINYRHVIRWLIRKPGAFERYRYKQDLFPSSYFRMAYDQLLEKIPTRAHKEYLAILYLAATENETAVEIVIRELLMLEQPLNSEAIKDRVLTISKATVTPDVKIRTVTLAPYDTLLSNDIEKQEVQHEKG